MNIKQIFLIVSTVLATIAPFFYAYEILNKKAQPHRTTRFVLLVITTLSFASLFAQHNRVAVWLAGVDVIGSLAIFILSLKFGMGNWTKMDLLCLFIAAVGISIWKITSNPFLALYSAILADFTGVVPTLIKTFKLPDSESALYFTIGGIACLFNLLAAKDFTIQNISYPLYLVLINLFIVFLAIRPKLFFNRKP